jgi:hypothetical protein
MRESFREYEGDCRKLITGLKKALIDYLQCPADKVRWLKYAEGLPSGEGFIETTADRRMGLFEDTSYRFVLMIDFRPSELAEGGG